MSLVVAPATDGPEAENQLRRAAAPTRLWWVYVLVSVALATTGAGAAQALFVTHDFGDYNTSQVCLARNGISVSGALDPMVDGSVYAACTHDYNHVLALTTLAGAAALPVAAWLLMVLGGLGARWRLRSHRIAGVPSSALSLLTERFTALCDSQDLTGRRRPRLVLAPPATEVRETFTTGLPGARPWVVVPLAYAYADQAAFDAVAIHELGHARARDVLWASAVWWAGWLAVPALLLALIPLMDQPKVARDLYGGSLIIAVVAAVSMLVLRAALLRRRELAADRYVVEVTVNPAALTAIIRAESGRPPAGWSSRATAGLQRVFATHPLSADRLGAGVSDAHRWDSGFVFTTAVGIVAMLTYHGIYAVLGDLLGFVAADPRFSADAALAVAALLWASVVVPAWTRRAALTPPRWAGPWAGRLSA